jgi:uncharacterized protein YegL
MSQIPGAGIQERTMYIFWLLDCSTSMRGNKIQALNTVAREVLPHLQDVASSNIQAKVIFRVATFSSDAEWITEPTLISEFKWTDVEENRKEMGTAMGKAISLVVEQLQGPNMPHRGLAPVIILISDGYPSDPENFSTTVQQLKNIPWGRESVRAAIAIGDDADVDTLKFFVSGDYPVLVAENAVELKHWLRWTSLSAFSLSSKNKKKLEKNPDTGQLDIPQPPAKGEGDIPAKDFEPWQQ